MILPASSVPRWPAGSRLVLLRALSKAPRGEHGHLGAVAAEDTVVPIGANVGIVLDGQYALVDIDDPADPNALAWVAAMRLVPTWHQQSPREKATPEQRATNPYGWHWLVRLAPEVAARARNAKILGISGQPVGDVKVRGYVVAAGSSIRCLDGVTRAYELLDASPPAPAPAWLDDWLTEHATRVPTVTQRASTDGRRGIPNGEHHHTLLRYANTCRIEYGFDVSAIYKALKSFAEATLLDVDARAPFTDHYYESLAHDAATKYAPGVQPEDSGPLLPAQWINLATVPLIGAPMKWLLHGFIPRGELTMLFGDGGIGKSSFASWLAAETTKKGGVVAHLGIEEGYRRFGIRAVMMGADRSLIMSMANASQIQLPRDAQRLRDDIIQAKVELLYFDAIYSHFGTSSKMNMAERARLCLGPLAEIAQQTGCAIVCVFHINAEGDYMGSTEMKNVGRMMLEATRKDDNSPLIVRVKKTNFKKPDYAIAFEADEQPVRDPLTGAIELDINDDGDGPPIITPLTMMIPRRVANIEKEKTAGGPPPEAVPLDEQKTPTGQKPKRIRNARDSEVL